MSATGCLLANLKFGTPQNTIFCDRFSWVENYPNAVTLLLELDLHSGYNLKRNHIFKRGFMLITVEIPDSLAGQLCLGGKADLRSLLQALVRQRDAEGKLTAVQVEEALNLGGAATDELLSEHASSEMPAATGTTRPRRDVMARLRGIYGDLPMTGENAVLVARSMERY